MGVRQWLSDNLGSDALTGELISSLERLFERLALVLAEEGPYAWDMADPTEIETSARIVHGLLLSFSQRLVTRYGMTPGFILAHAVRFKIYKGMYVITLFDRVTDGLSRENGIEYYVRCSCRDMGRDPGHRRKSLPRPFVKEDQHQQVPPRVREAPLGRFEIVPYQIDHILAQRNEAEVMMKKQMRHVQRLSKSCKIC